MKNLKKNLSFFGVILLMILLLGLLCFFFARPWYYRLFYPWDRVTGTVRVELDGKPAAFTIVKNDAMIEQGRTRSSPIQGNGSTRVSTHAAEYGKYSFEIQVEGLEQAITATVYQYNWWNVCNFELEVSIDRAVGIVTLVSTAQTLNEEGLFLTEEHTRMLHLPEDDLQIAITTP